MSKFRNNVAAQVGINAAIVAEYLWYLLTEEVSDEDAFCCHGYYWCRCSALTITGEYPYLSLHMVKDAIENLHKNNYIRKGCFNDNKFDHTNWYAFTDYGMKMMEDGWTA
jgi:hypothetical protein